MNKSLPTLETLLFKEIEPQIGLVTLNCPDRLNAINDRLLDEFYALLDILDREDTLRVLIITGAGRGFCAGADLKEIAARAQSEAFSDPESFLRLVQEKYAGLILRLRAISQPVIAAVNGAAAGGGMAIALAADVRVCSPEAYFVASFINIGLSGGEMGSSFLLPRDGRPLQGRRYPAYRTKGFRRRGGKNRTGEPAGLGGNPPGGRSDPCPDDDRQDRGRPQTDQAGSGAESNGPLPGGGHKPRKPQPGPHGLFR